MKLYIQPVRDVFQTNAYFYMNEKTGHGCLIDPGAQPELLLQIVRQRHWQIDAIILTHGHFDHTGAVDQLTKALKIPFYIHERGPEYLVDNELNLAHQNNRQIKIDQTPRLLKDNDHLSLAKVGVNFELLYAPGHSFDSVVYYDAQNGIAFVGDVLYNDGPGIWQFPGGNQTELIKSLKRLSMLPDNTRCFVGHTRPMQISQVNYILQHLTDYHLGGN
ncbi:MBL fold metallo-hydrolase [Limosilactobacillus sp. WF-MT5-A]|uniref:MBL fold metallo-hydrolase n=1 Tax=Limosilactobacillus agrestis TaxID=2759748 RepID=UPI0015FBE6F6|nr:MBL fold metallo-hydrolase [Limosilactobacillus agrestis]MBB1098766.1 MBL fold metallo-hydrolase [Limosilactobacillus agrestis]MCD7125731.1 MBL fold metallo-hydrolase [Limosilactobacillus agrestis]